MDFVNTIKNIDTQLFLFLNSQHNDFFDIVMYWISDRFIWIPLYIFLLYLVYKHTGKHVWLAMFAVVLLIVLSDQVSVHAFKNVVHRLRPCHNPDIQSMVHLLNGRCGGSYGFVSSHAANVFALAMFLFLFFREKINNFGVWIFAWASVVAYSRVYAGVHYPGDIIVGALLGAGIGVAVYKLYQSAVAKIIKT